MAAGSKKAVVYAIVGNGTITVLKFIAAALTASASMMNEAVHSLMDTINQIFLFLGIRAGERPSDLRYAFGHGQKKYLWNLWSAIGLFSIGAGLGLAHAWHAWHKLDTVQIGGDVQFLGLTVNSVIISAVVLLIALVVEGYVLSVAAGEFLSRMRAAGEISVLRYIVTSDDPTLTAVVLEDSVAVFGVLLAGAGIGLSVLTGNPIWDIVFSVAIAVVLGVIAFFLGWINMRLLTNVRDADAERAFREVAQEHPEIETYHDLRSIVIDDSHTVVVAEIEVREEALMQNFQERVARQRKLIEATARSDSADDQAFEDYVATRAVMQATLERTEEVVDELERAVREKAPRISHITIEVEGLAQASGLEVEAAPEVT